MTPYLSRFVVASAYAMHLYWLCFTVNMHKESVFSLIIIRITQASVKCNIPDCVWKNKTSKLVKNAIFIYLFVIDTHIDPAQEV